MLKLADEISYLQNLLDLARDRLEVFLADMLGESLIDHILVEQPDQQAPEHIVILVVTELPSQKEQEIIREKVVSATGFVADFAVESDFDDEEGEELDVDN